MVGQPGRLAAVSSRGIEAVADDIVTRRRAPRCYIRRPGSAGSASARWPPRRAPRHHQVELLTRGRPRSARRRAATPGIAAPSGKATPELLVPIHDQGPTGSEGVKPLSTHEIIRPAGTALSIDRVGAVVLRRCDLNGAAERTRLLTVTAVSGGPPAADRRVAGRRGR